MPTPRNAKPAATVAPKSRKNVGTPGAPKVSAPVETKTTTGTDPETPNPERGALPPTGPVAFYIDGRRLGFTQHRLSYVAGYTADRTAGIPRVPVRDLTAFLLRETGFATEADLYVREYGPIVLPGPTARVFESRRIEGRDGLVVPDPKPAAKPRRARTAKAS
jgi:hypothetical protein